MRKFAAVVVAVAVAAMFTVPAFAAECGCPKPCACPKPCECPKKACPTCGQPCNIIQDAANVVTGMKAPCIQPCSPCAKCPESKPCATCGQPCNIAQATANAIQKIEAPSLPCPKPCKPCAEKKPCAPCEK